jgi:succinyl-CoA synthetase beta subunit/citryl-CoA synthetase large subunit
MARLTEGIAKDILKRNGVAVPDFSVVENSEQAIASAGQMGLPVVLKGLVPLGKRKKAGAVKFAHTLSEVESNARAILGMEIQQFPVHKILIESKLDIAQEFYLSITYDDTQGAPVFIACSEGGIDIEEIAAKFGNKIIKHYIDLSFGFHPFHAREICTALGLSGKTLQKGTQIVFNLYKIFEKYDATILEINPLVITADGDITVAAVLMGIDDDALYRQPELKNLVEPGSDRAWRPLTPLEKEMMAVDDSESYRGTARYTEMDGGNIGFLCGGGGGSLLAYDALLRYGGQPANYTEFGGNPPENKVMGLVKGVLSKAGVKSFFMATNITNNTQTDVVAKGVIRAFQEKNIDPAVFPTVVRLPGVNDAEARRLFNEFGIEYYGSEISIEDAARIIVEKMNSTYANEV